MKTKDILLAATRIALGWTFLWAFIDKLFGLGFSTCRNAETGETAVRCASSWLGGGSPTAGFLSNAVKGPFADQFSALAGAPWVDWLFMIGLCAIGVALILGIAMRMAGIAGALMMFLMYFAVMPPATNPFVDDHIIYALILLVFSTTVSIGDTLGIGREWRRSRLVSRLPFLK